MAHDPDRADHLALAAVVLIVAVLVLFGLVRFVCMCFG